jgi:hypothetical protein
MWRIVWFFLKIVFYLLNNWRLNLFSFVFLFFFLSLFFVFFLFLFGSPAFVTAQTATATGALGEVSVIVSEEITGRLSFAFFEPFITYRWPLWYITMWQRHFTPIIIFPYKVTNVDNIIAFRALIINWTSFVCFIDNHLLHVLGDGHHLNAFGFAVVVYILIFLFFNCGSSQIYNVKRGNNPRHGRLGFATLSLLVGLVQIFQKIVHRVPIWFLVNSIETDDVSLDLLKQRRWLNNNFRLLLLFFFTSIGCIVSLVSWGGLSLLRLATADLILLSACCVDDIPLIDQSW